MGPGSDDLKTVAAVTLRHYNQRADAFWEGTRGHDVTQNIAAMLKYIRGAPPFAILDFGCGPGRDLKASVARAHRDRVGGGGRVRRDGPYHAAAKSGSRIFSRWSFRAALRRHLRQCVVVSRTDAGIAARARRAARRTGARRRAVQFESARQERGGLERGNATAPTTPPAWRRYYRRPASPNSNIIIAPGDRPAEQPWLASVWRRG